VRGYFGIGIESPKWESNVGTLWRSAYCLGAAFIFTIGMRYKHQATDTTCAWRHIPLFHYDCPQAFLDARPMDCTLVGVELTQGAEPLETFGHPERVLYILGPEDGSLSLEVQAACDRIVKFDSRYCLNVASAGTVVMYDRQTKTAKDRQDGGNEEEAEA
jgi:tRNA G18 (ribose-2'-O)-methylase SpoU